MTWRSDPVGLGRTGDRTLEVSTTGRPRESTAAIDCHPTDGNRRRKTDPHCNHNGNNETHFTMSPPRRAKDCRCQIDGSFMRVIVAVFVWKSVSQCAHILCAEGSHLHAHMPGPSVKSSTSRSSDEPQVSARQSMPLLLLLACGAQLEQSSLLIPVSHVSLHCVRCCFAQVADAPGALPIN